MSNDLIPMTIDEMRKLNGLDRSIALTNRRVWLEKERKQDLRELGRNRQKIWVHNNKDYCNNRRREYREKNKDKINQHKREYYKENSDKILQYQKDYRAKKKEVKKIDS